MRAGRFNWLRLAVSRLTTSLVLTGMMATVDVRAEEISGETLPVCDLQPAAPIPGTLLICGGGSLPDSLIDQFFELAGGKNARIVLITTATSYAGTPELAARYASWRTRPHASFDFFHARTREEANSPDYCQALAAATGIWFTGGNQNLLTEAYLGTHALDLFRAVLERGGVVAGTSAGAAIMSPAMIAGGRTEPILATGFGFLPGTIVDQHFRNRNREGRLRQAIQMRPGHVGIGIDESTALVVRGRSVEVVGESEVTFCLAPSPHRPAAEVRLARGGRDDLIKLSRAAIARSRQEIPVPSRRLPEVKQGTLVIVGGGATPPEAVDHFLQAAGGKDAPIVVVSNALGEEPPEERQVCGWLTSAGATNVTHIHPRDHQEQAQLNLQACLRNARGVWFTGGRQWRLVDAFLDTPVQTLFHEVLRRGGVIGGTSAGASIQGEFLVRGNPLGNKEIVAEGYERGFGFLPGVAIDQHFSQRDRFEDMTELKRSHPQLVGIGIDEATALIVRGTTLEVVGRNSVAIFDRDSATPTEPAPYEIVKAGQKYDFKNQRRMEQAVAATEDSTSQTE